MIISISGAACTGKTTLLDHIKSNTHNYGKDDVCCYGEFIRNVFDRDYKDKYEDYAELLKGDPIDIIDIHKETAKYFNEILWSSDLNKLLIFDRSPLDIQIYLYMNLSNYLKSDGELLRRYREASNYIYRCSVDFMGYNPLLFYTRPFSDDIENDGFRPMSLIDRRALELSLFDREFLSHPNVVILPSNLEDRFSIIEESIKSRIIDINKRRDPAYYYELS